MKLHVEAPLKGARILIAEDDAILALDLMTALQAAGAEVLGPARTLAQALAFAAAQAPTCAVLDVNLRGETSFPAAQLLQERRIGIVFYTGYGDLDALQRDWPEANVLAKPAPIDVLMRIVIAACCANGALSVEGLLPSFVAGLPTQLFSAPSPAGRFIDAAVRIAARSRRTLCALARSIGAPFCLETPS